MPDSPISNVIVTRVGEWFIVSANSPRYEYASGRYEACWGAVGSFRSSHDAMDLREALLRAEAGDLKAELYMDGPLSDD